MTRNKISWCLGPDGAPGFSWNVTGGCSPVSAGCAHCWASRLASTRLAHRPEYAGLAKDGTWLGHARFFADRLAEPLRRKKPTGICVSLMGDLFHEDITDEQIAAVFGVAAACPTHRFYFLTKRAKRQREWFEWPGIADLVEMFRQVAVAGRIEEYFSEERTVDIAAWPGYAVTSRGRVLSTKRGEEREMSVIRGEQGHGRVMLYRDGVNERPLVHRLVLAAFDREPHEGEQGRHITGDATNNALWNLRWGTQSENWDDSKRHGTRRRYSKLTDEQVVEIRRLGAEAVSGTEIGRSFGISDTQARNIVTGKQWTPEYKLEWPLRSVWLGVSIEDQPTADERIPKLLQTPAAVRWLSLEPMLGSIDISRWIGYHPNHETSGNREGTTQGRTGGMDRSQGGRFSLETRATAQERMERQCHGEEGCAPPDRLSSGSGVQNCQGDGGWKTDDGSSTQACVDSSEGGDSSGADHQPQERRQGGQSTGEFGSRNLFREHETRVSNRADGRIRREKSTGKVERRRDRGNSEDVCQPGDHDPAVASGQIRSGLPDDFTDSEGRISQAAGRSDSGLCGEKTKAEGAEPLGKISMIVVGCESGSGARPMEDDWVRSIRDQCQAAGVAFFFKQAMFYYDGWHLDHEPELDGRTWRQMPVES